MELYFDKILLVLIALSGVICSCICIYHEKKSYAIDKHLKNGCKPQDLHIATKFFENLDTEDYKKDKIIDL